MNEVGRWFCLILATEALTELLVDSKLLTNFRSWLFKLANPELHDTDIAQSEPIDLWQHSWAQLVWFLNQIFSCGYCMSVWVALPLATLAPWVHQFGENLMIYMLAWVVNWLVAVLVLHRLSNWLHVLFSLVKKGRVKAYDIVVTQQTGAG